MTCNPIGRVFIMTELLAVPTEARQIFKGWMFASSPGVSGLQHPIYDAWVVGCKA